MFFTIEFDEYAKDSRSNGLDATEEPCVSIGSERGEKGGGETEKGTISRSKGKG